MSEACGPLRAGPLRLVALVLALFLCGCGHGEPPRFQLNLVAIKFLRPPADESLSLEEATQASQVFEEQQQQIAEILAAMFGTPDEPFVFPESGLDLKKLKLAAGPVWHDQGGKGGGLYRRHCVHCHGITGDGRGPTAAFLNPYPRDYRGAMDSQGALNTGGFKFKSTYRGEKPTTDDLRHIVREGIPDTAMPSFRMLPDDEVDALIEYVKYLNMRGETELRLIKRVIEGEELSAGRDVLIEKAGAEEEDEQAILQVIAGAWKRADTMVVVPPPAPAETPLDESIALGRELFYGQAANCVKCHGNTALGDGLAPDPADPKNSYDDWSQAITAADVAEGALPPRFVVPRNLRRGVFRGGLRPLDLYWRIFTGINGTPMPGLGPSEKDGTAAFKQEDIWHIVHYVQSLPFENGGAAQPHETTALKQP